ncbi:hypothetical protein IH970_12905 [candidate division KSB1 bacterium]|nr:hypothetical protein [candidate division KSB1 bacterium]
MLKLQLGVPHCQKLRKFLKDKVQTVQNEVAVKEVKPNLDKLIANRIRIGKNLYQRALKLANEK